MSVNSSRRVDMHAFACEYRLGQGCASNAQLDDSLAARRSCASSLRARLSSESWPATADGNGRLSEPFEPLCYRKDRSYSSESKDKACAPDK
jgi:hypothetical protein